MHRRLIGVLTTALAFSGALAIAGLSSAATEAKKQRVAIDQLERPGWGTWALLPESSGPITEDKGRYTWTHKPAVNGTRDGQRFKRYDSVVTFAGKNGDLVVREIVTLVPAAAGVEAGTGTWKVLRGTEAYAGVKGGGRLGAVVGAVQPAPWRYEGFLVSP